MNHTDRRTTELPASKRLASRYLAILIASLCLLATVLEAVTRLALPKLSRTEGRIDAEYRASLALRSGAHKNMLVAGNSLLLADVDILKLQSALASDSGISRYTVEQTSYLDWYYALRLWYAKGASADLVLVCLNSRQTISDSVRGDYFAYRMMRTADFWSASRDARLSPTNTFSLLLGSVSAFYGTRTEIRKVLLSRLVPGVSDVARLVAPPPNTAPLEYDFPVEAVAGRLTRMRALVGGHRGRLMLLAPATRDAEDLRILQLAGVLAGVTVIVPLQASSVLPSDFEDGFHLNSAGEAKYTDALISRLRQAIAAPDPGLIQPGRLSPKQAERRVFTRAVPESTYRRGTMDTKKLSAWWFHRQGLAGGLRSESASNVLSKTGWARSVGGVGPYLTLFARGSISRETADAAVAGLEIHELPAARGCTYVVPACDFPLALKAASAFGDGERKVASKLGVTDREIAKLCEAVLKALGKGPLDPDEIRQACGNASRSLGEEGKKKGLTTTLPLALGELQVTGDIRRVPMNDRLDQQRYRYCLWKPNPRERFRMDDEEVASELARRYFRWIGPATISEFQWFSAFGAKAANAALEPLKLELLAKDAPLLILPSDRERFEAFKVPKQPQYSLVASVDGVSLLKRNTKDLIDSEYLKNSLFQHKGYAGAGLADLPSHGIFDRGRVVGLWEYDIDTKSIAWASFIPKNKDLTNAVGEMQEYVTSQLGDARSFSLDSPKSRTPRLEALRKAN